MAVTNKQRLDLIERYLRQHQYADLHTLGREFDISLSTVRRALNDLEAKGLVRRHHGGASLVEEEGVRGYDFITQDDRQNEEKHLIAERIAAHIEPGMTVMLDGGTTTYRVARMLVNKRVIVVTNSLPIAILFSEVGSSDTIVTGGTVYSRLGVLLGPTCDAALGSMHADLAILGAAGLTEEGIWNTNPLIISAQRKMVGAADQAFFGIDSTKFGKRALALAIPFEPTITVVSDRTPPLPIREAILTKGCSLDFADADPSDR